MAAEVEKMFSVRRPTWHGLENMLHEYPSRDEAQIAAGHSFDVIREPLYRKQINPDLTETYELYTPAEINVRSDNGLDIGVVPTERVDIQPAEMWDLADWIKSNMPGVEFETAGTLNQGANVWILMKQDKILRVKGDRNSDTQPFFALQNGYQQGSSFRFQQILTRIVCWNTSQMADVEADAANHTFTLAHTLNLRDRIEGIKQAMLAWEAEASHWVEAKEHMLSLPTSLEGRIWFLENMIPMPDERITSRKVKENVELARMELLGELYNERNVGIEETSLGLFEAVSSWNEHVRAAQTPQTRFQRSILTRGTILSTARELAIQAATI